MPDLPLLILLLTLPALASEAASFRDGVNARSFAKGQLHAHTLESDGDAPPSEVAAWYADHGYAFLALTDHDKMTFVADPPLPMLPGVEITAHGGGRPVHVNALCGTTALEGGHFPTPEGALADAVRRARADGAFVLVNHPLWAHALTARDLLAAPPFDAVEIASGHPAVGDAAEAVWQTLLDHGRFVYAAAVDDSHDFRKPGEGRKPGRAWIEAWDADGGAAGASDAKGACAALRAGRFYATTGPLLTRLSVSGGLFTVAVDALPAGGVVEFLGEGWRLLARSSASPAQYRLRGGERFVRARVLLPDGRKAWTQAYRAD